MKYLEARKARIEIIPMIDIMFFLLVFFIMITMHMIPNAGLATKLPQSSTAQPLDKPKVVLTLAEDGSMSVDGHALTAQQLEDQLKLNPDPSQVVVTIAGSGSAKLQYLVTAMDACRAAGVTQVGLATDPKAN